jgi:hypothetical protein
MPLDRIKARQCVEGARHAYRIGVRADFIQVMADHLEEALKVVETATYEVNTAKNDSTRIQRELDDEKTAYRKLREASVHTENCVLVLKAIAANPKGAAKKAAEQLRAMGVVTEGVL